MAVTGTFVVDSSFTVTSTVGPDTKSVQSRIDYRKTFTDGTGENQVNKSFGKTATLAATSETLDLQNLTGPFGETHVLTKVKTLVIRNESTTSGHVLKVGGAASNIFASIVDNANDIIIVPPKGILVLTSPFDGFTVSATVKNLKIDAGANSIQYTIQIEGS